MRPGLCSLATLFSHSHESPCVFSEKSWHEAAEAPFSTRSAEWLPWTWGNRRRPGCRGPDRSDLQHRAAATRRPASSSCAVSREAPSPRCSQASCSGGCVCWVGAAVCHCVCKGSLRVACASCLRPVVTSSWSRYSFPEGPLLRCLTASVETPMSQGRGAHVASPVSTCREGAALVSSWN